MARSQKYKRLPVQGSCNVPRSFQSRHVHGSACLAHMRHLNTFKQAGWFSAGYERMVSTNHPLGVSSFLRESLGSTPTPGTVIPIEHQQATGLLLVCPHQQSALPCPSHTPSAPQRTINNSQNKNYWCGVFWVAPLVFCSCPPRLQ